MDRRWNAPTDECRPLWREAVVLRCERITNLGESQETTQKESNGDLKPEEVGSQNSGEEMDPLELLMKPKFREKQR